MHGFIRSFFIAFPFGALVVAVDLWVRKGPTLVQLAGIN